MSSSNPGDEPRAPAGLLRYLRSGVRSTHEVVSRLRQHGVSSRDAARLVRAYRARGVLDDRAGVRLWADHWARQGYASAAIRLKLAAKGFDAQAIEDTVSRFVPPSDDEARARVLLAQRRDRVSGRPGRARLARALAAHGFEPDVIERLLGESWQDSCPPDDAER